MLTLLDNYPIKLLKVWYIISNKIVLLHNIYIYFFLRLFVRVENLDGLAPKGKDKRPYKTVLKLTLLPQEKTTKTSKTIAAAMSPVVNEDFFISTKCISNKVLR